MRGGWEQWRGLGNQMCWHLLLGALRRRWSGHPHALGTHPWISLRCLLGDPCRLLCIRSQSFRIYRSIVALVLVQTCVSRYGRHPSSTSAPHGHGPVLTVTQALLELLLLLWGLELRDAPSDSSNTHSSHAARSHRLLRLGSVPAVDHSQPAVMAGQEGGTRHGSLQQGAVGGPQGHGRVAGVGRGARQ